MTGRCWPIPMTGQSRSQDGRIDTGEADAEALEAAADVIEARSPRRSFVLAVLCGVLRKRAARIRAGR